MTTGDMTAKQLEETLTTIATAAKSLRDAGVTGLVTVGDVSFSVEASEAVPAAATHAAPATPEFGSALDDPDTFGGYVPQPRKALQPPDNDDEQE